MCTVDSSDLTIVEISIFIVIAILDQPLISSDYKPLRTV